MARDDALRGRESGSATVLMVGILVALTSLLLGGLMVCAAVVAGHRAAAAADLAALAGAAQWAQRGDAAAACARAERVSAANRAALTRCDLDGEDVVVEVAVPMPGGRLELPDAVGRSRAGPARVGPHRRE